MATFPFYLHVAGVRIHPHPFFEALAYFVAARVFFWYRRRVGDTIDHVSRWAIVAAAAAGAVVGSRALFWLEDPALTWAHRTDFALLLGGKTIVGGLLGGLLVVEFAKRLIAIRERTGDLFAVPLALGLVLGRIGCFLTGLADHTHGTVTSLPWGVDFGDGIRRHPTQLYEALFCLSLAILLHRLLRRPHESGDVFKAFMVAYLGMRLWLDSLKPSDPAVFLGLQAIQWACLVGLLYYVRDVRRWIAPALPATAIAAARREGASR